MVNHYVTRGTHNEKSKILVQRQSTYVTKKPSISTTTAALSESAAHILVETVEPVKGALVELRVFTDGLVGLVVVALTGFREGDVKLLG